MRKEDIRNNKLILLGSLFTDLMHEIRNPLSVLKINYELLEDEKNFASDDVEELLGSGKEAISIIEEVISQTMEFIRGNDGNFENCSVDILAKKAYNFMKNRAKKEGVEFKLYLSAEDANIFANKSQIIQVLLNLLKNAFDAVENEPKIFIKTYKTAQGVFIEIRDNGKGIEKELINDIFDKYYTTKDNGTGIGLAVTKEIIDKHNAEILVESIPGKGTSFILKFNYSEENI